MPKKLHKQRFPVKLCCRCCGAKYAGTKQGPQVISRGLKQHIVRSPKCLELYSDSGLVARGRKVSLKNSIVENTPPSSPDVMSLGATSPNSPDTLPKKRSIHSYNTNEPQPKRLLLSELSSPIKESKFGALPKSNMLLRGEAFANKNTLINRGNKKAPPSKELDKMFFHGDAFFSQFSSEAVAHHPTLLHFVTPYNGIPSHPNHILDTSDHLDDSSEESDNNPDGGSIRTEAENESSEEENDSEDEDEDEENDENPSEGTQRSDVIAQNFNAHVPTNFANLVVGTIANSLPGDPPNQASESTPPIENQQQTRPFQLLERWEIQKKATTIHPMVTPDPAVISNLSLLQIQHKYGIPLAGIREIQKWAHDSYNSHNLIFKGKPPTRKKQFKRIRQAMGIPREDKFTEVAIDWLPEKKKRPIHVRSFEDCLYELLSNQELTGTNGCNISLPHPSDPYKTHPDQLPTYSSQLHHGWWWRETMTECCKKEKEILVPIIGYMDGVATDTNDRLPVCPFNITLGIFNTTTRRKADAWTTMLLYPDDKSEASLQKGTEAIHKLQNLHNSLHCAFTDLRQLMESDKSIPWKLQYGPRGIEWDVQLKFAFAYVIGDTEMHDKLCGRYGTRTRNIKSICRHCDCATEDLAQGRDIFEANSMFTPEKLDPESHDAEYFQSVSHHPIDNAFHDMYFGANKFNIHLATPGECLHMVQKGVCVRVVESLANIWRDPTAEQDDVAAVEGNHKSKIYLAEFDKLGKIYGAHLSRQSDRNKPRTKFQSSLFSKTKASTNLFNLFPPEHVL